MKPEGTERLFIEGVFKRSGLPSEDLQVLKLTGDASTRRYFRLTTKNKNYVVCLDDPIANDQKYTFEEVQNVFCENQIRVPQIHYINREKGFIVEEDLGNKTLLESLGQTVTKDELRSYYYPVLDELIKIHKIDYKKYEGSCFSSLKFDQAKLHDETRLTNHNFIIKLLGTAQDDSSINVLDQYFGNICKYLGVGNWVVTHRDFHSRNIMILDNKPVVIDFQDARLGIPQYDLVSLLEDCYFYVEGDVKEDLINYYLDNCGFKIDNFHKDYDLMAIQRLYKAIGSFSYIYNTRKDSRYLKFIGRAFEKILMFLSRHEQYHELRKTLAKIYYAS